MRLSAAGQRFYQEVQKSDGQLNLAAAALYIAQEEYWDMDASAYLERLNDMAAAVRSRIPKGRYPLKVIQTINDYLFGELKFSGNQQNYYDPDNSLLNRVIDRRLGIPISLSLVYLEVASRVNFPMVGVGMPGHFLVRPVVEDMEVFVDPFHDGEVMFEADCQERFAQMFPGAQWQSDFLGWIGPRPFLARMLMNLKGVYVKTEAYDEAVAVLDKLLILMPNEVQQQRDRGLIHHELQNYDLAKRDLEEYLRSHPRAPDGRRIQQIIAQLERNL